MASKRHDTGSRFPSSLGQAAGSEEGVRRRASQMTESAQSYLGQTYHGLEDTVIDHPATSALVVFGAGLGIGILIGAALAPQREPQILRSGWLDSRKAEKVGRRVLDAMSEYLPQSISSRMG